MKKLVGKHSMPDSTHALHVGHFNSPRSRRICSSRHRRQNECRHGNTLGSSKLLKHRGHLSCSLNWSEKVAMSMSRFPHTKSCYNIIRKMYVNIIYVLYIIWFSIIYIQNAHPVAAMQLQYFLFHTCCKTSVTINPSASNILCFEFGEN